MRRAGTLGTLLLVTMAAWPAPSVVGNHSPEPMHVDFPLTGQSYPLSPMTVRWVGPAEPSTPAPSQYVVEVRVYPTGSFTSVPGPYGCEPNGPAGSSRCSAAWTPPASSQWELRVRHVANPANPSCLRSALCDAESFRTDGEPPAALPPCVWMPPCVPAGTTLTQTLVTVRAAASDAAGALQEAEVEASSPGGTTGCTLVFPQFNQPGTCQLNLDPLLVDAGNGLLEADVDFVTHAVDLAGNVGESSAVPYRVEVPAPPPGTPGFSNTSVFPGNYENGSSSYFSRPLRPGAYGFFAPQVVNLASTLDGQQIQVGLLRPNTGQRVPVIVHASPYYAPLHTIDLAAWAQPLSQFVAYGYAVAIVPVRGSADAGGCMDLMGPKERHDLDQAVTWLGTQAWSNGNVGMIGVSYDGSTPWEVASLGSPHLKTIVPISGLSDIYHLAWHNGTAEFRAPVFVEAGYYTYGFFENSPLNGRSLDRTVQGVVCPESWKAIAASVESTATGARDHLGVWSARNSRPGVEANYTGSVLLVHGLQDWNVDPHHAYPWVQELEDRGVVVKHLLGQWGHSWPDEERRDWAEILLHWFDYWLNENPNADLGPRAQVQDNTGRWRNEATWPPKDAAWESHYLGGGGTLTSAPGPGADPVPVAPDPQSVGGGWSMPPCTGCAVFRGDPLPGETRYSGIPRVHVTVTPTGPGGHVAAFLYREDPQGRLRFLGWGQMDLRFAAGGETPQVVTPNAPLLAKMVLEPLDVVVPADDRLVLVLSQGAYGDHVASVPTYPVRLHVGGDESRMTLPHVERPPGAFFEAPPSVLGGFD